VDTATNTTLGKVSLDHGQATLVTTAMLTGDRTISVMYAGDSNYLPSNGSVQLKVLTSVYVLNASAKGALTLTGNAVLNVPGQIVVDSSSDKALDASGNAIVEAGSIQLAGGFSASVGTTLAPQPVTGIRPQSDPLATLAVPTGGTPQASVDLSKGSLTIDPGVYDGIKVSGTGVLKLNPGTYVIKDGGFSVSGGGSVIGAGVMIYNAGADYDSSKRFGQIDFSGQGVIDLSPATSGPYAGILFFQARDNTQSVAFTGQAISSFHGGLVYASAAELSLSGNAVISTSLIVDEITIRGVSTDGLDVLANQSKVGAATPAILRW
jgi:hypothetical protein